MNMMQPVLILALLALALNGCSTKGGAEGEGANAAGGYGSGKAGARTGQYGRGADGGRGYGLNGDSNDASGPPAQRVIYFMYDSDEVMPEYVPVIAAHASYLAAHAEQNAVLEGHADERGSSEYNIALGEQRAKSVLRSMQLQGAGDNQARTVSYGEEKPAVAGHDETAWQQNRRVEISYSGR